jgi:hypothetical protein
MLTLHLFSEGHHLSRINNRSLLSLGTLTRRMGTSRLYSVRPVDRCPLPILYTSLTFVSILILMR